MNEYVIVLVYDKMVTSNSWHVVEFRRYKDTFVYVHFVDGYQKKTMTFEEMQNELLIDRQSKFAMTEQEMDQNFLNLGYTLMVQGIDQNDETLLFFPFIYEIRKYHDKNGKTVYKKKRRGELRDMGFSQAVEQIASVNADIQEIKDRRIWKGRGITPEQETVLPYLQKCWEEIDRLKVVKIEYDRLRNQGTWDRMLDNKKQNNQNEDTVQVKEELTGRETVERGAWQKMLTKGLSIWPEKLTIYLYMLWGEIDTLRKFKYRIEFLETRNFASRLLNLKALDLSHLLAELKGLNTCL